MVKLHNFLVLKTKTKNFTLTSNKEEVEMLYQKANVKNK